MPDPALRFRHDDALFGRFRIESRSQSLNRVVEATGLKTSKGGRNSR
jgi:hypothetical protein